jgi:hypothetical protein
MPDGILAGRGPELCLFFFYKKKRGKNGICWARVSQSRGKRIDAVFAWLEKEKRMKRCGLDNGLQGRERLALDGERRGDAVLSGQRWGRRKREARGEKEEGIFAGLDDEERV